MNARIRTKIRIFVASPRDVAEERRRLALVVEQLNRGLADWLELAIELQRWETHVAPGTGRPQGVILDQLPPNQWDIFIGILWLRFGTETGGSDPNTGQPYLGGTEEEFNAAYRYRQASRSTWPKVMFYRCMRPADLSRLDVTQYGRVAEFFNGFAAAGTHPGLVSEYQQPEEFERLVRAHLEQHLREFVGHPAKIEDINPIDARPRDNYIHARLNALKIPLLLLSLWSWLMLSWGKMILAMLVVLSLVLIGFIGWNRPLRHVPEAIWMRLPLYNQPPPVPLSTNQNLATKQILKYYGDRANNETGTRFDKELSRRFRIDTGIEVKVTNSSPEDRLYGLKNTLVEQSSEFDVILIDIIWVGELAEHLIDLTPYFEKEIGEHQTVLIKNNTVDGKLVAIPWFEDFGLLYYRTDLLKEPPPDSWEQLEKIAAKIQQSKKHIHFIGFAWQGMSYEGLTCNALEWIASRGGYNTEHENIHDRQIVVDALESARNWSRGPSPISYGVDKDMEEESLERFRRGEAAFLRMWSSAYAKLKQANVSFDVAPLPAKVSMVGGWQLAVPKYSRHSDAAVEFIRYLTSSEVQTWRALQGTYLPTINTVTKKLRGEKQLSSLYNAINNRVYPD